MPSTPLTEEERGRLQAALERYHHHMQGPVATAAATSDHECSSLVVQRIKAPPDAIWSFVRRFDHPQAYKHFIRDCIIRAGNPDQSGCIREVQVVSDIPATTSTERLEILDEENHVIGFRVLGGDHRLQNYSSITTLHAWETGCADDPPLTIVLESYIVDIPAGNSREDTRIFADTVIHCNLQALAHLAENLHKKTITPENSS